MTESPLQKIFINNLARSMKASRRRVAKQIGFLSAEEQNKVDAIVWNEIKGLVHGVMCEFDGATSLADHGLITITDDNGNEFVRYLHELTFDGLDSSEL